MARAGWTKKALSEGDVRILRGFVRQALLPYVEGIRRFYRSEEPLNAETGCHPWQLRERGDAEIGYMVVREGPRDFKSTDVFPYVNPSKIDIGVPGGARPAVLEEVMFEPLAVEEFYVYYKRGKLCFLERGLHEAEMEKVKLKAAVILSRKEAFALLDGAALPATLKKVRHAFGIKEEK